MKTKNKYMIPVYALLVRAGKWLVVDEDNEDKKPIVPELYREDVAEYLATREG
ncbi:hypothetical protein HMPREF1147_1350 [Selenomonas sp. FOBRC9]|uniref:CD1375 family protein n=1 Tax=Selenomonas sp. FOBRC9 TaxID=936573 RepID=UPI00027A6331|nr:CD1375 family protein [Selenomonas sp. FOBRC9]EJP32324.1 hypothetical protein HMPREF1147_1350 [Selenomonas sp. FOBRC9]